GPGLCELVGVGPGTVGQVLELNLLAGQRGPDAEQPAGLVVERVNRAGWRRLQRHVPLGVVTVAGEAALGMELPDQEAAAVVVKVARLSAVAVGRDRRELATGVVAVPGPGAVRVLDAAQPSQPVVLLDGHGRHLLRAVPDLLLAHHPPG